MISTFLDLEKDLRLSEACHAACSSLGLPRNMSKFRCEEWFAIMEDQGFLVDGKFLPIIDILDKTKNMSLTARVFTLESVGADLSLLI